MIKRETEQIFDRILKRLVKLSSRTVIHFVNGLFGAEHPLDSEVFYPATESVDGDLKLKMADIIVVIGGTSYHIETAGDMNGNLLLRVFQYGYAEGIRTRESSFGEVVVHFPDPRVICWEAGPNAPELVTLRLKFADGRAFDYPVKVFHYLRHSLNELAEQNLILLLPYHMLKFRQRLNKAAPEERIRIAPEMAAALNEVVAKIEGSVVSGVLAREDLQTALELTDTFYKEIFGQYSELKGVDKMLEEKLLTRTEILLIETEKRVKAETEKRVKAETEKRVKAETEKRVKAETIRSMRAEKMSDEWIAKVLKLPLPEVREVK